MTTASAKTKTPSTELLSAETAPSYAESMIRTVNISDAKANLSKLADEVSSGDEVIVSRSGKPVMKLVSLNAQDMQSPRPNGHYRKLGAGAIFLEDFDWDLWDESDRDMERIWKKFGYMQG
jgi:prevent-host-death family protein